VFVERPDLIGRDEGAELLTVKAETLCARVRNMAQRPACTVVLTANLSAARVPGAERLRGEPMEHRTARGERALTSAILIVAATAWIVVAQADPAWAVCGGTSQTRAIGAVNFDDVTYGNRARAWVNNFGSNQHQTWRSVAVFQNSNNLAEAGRAGRNGETDRR
jgi:hypothetical protein